MRFEEILIILTVFSGIVYALNYLYRKKHKISLKAKGKWYIDEVVALFPVLILVLVLRSFIFEPFRIPTGSMKPTLLEGDFILVNKFAYGLRLPISGNVIMPVSKPKTGDIVVFRHDVEGKDLIKRVIGVPGDRVRYVDNQLYINDQLITHTKIEETMDNGIPAVESKEHLLNIVHDIYDYPQIQRHYNYTDVIVPQGKYFVMGDNRSNSIDSRVWGFLDDKDLLGKAVATWMSWNSNDPRILPVRWSRIGKSVYQYADQQ